MIKNTRKLWYSIGAIAIIVVLGVLAYQSGLTGKLTGELKLSRITSTRITKPVRTGSLQVFTNIPEGRYEIRDAASEENVGSGQGTERTYFILPVGLYTVTFLEVEGYTIDIPVRTANITAGSSLGAHGVYEAEAIEPVGTLTVTKTDTPVSQTHVKGADNVPALGFAMTAGERNITVNRIVVRAYGDGDDNFGTTSPPGDTAANTIVASVMLYDENNDVVAGPEALQLVDSNEDDEYGRGDYYKAVFDDLNLKIGENSTKTLTARVNLLNTMQNTTYLALDIGTNDIKGMDTEGNAVSAPADHLNLSFSPKPMTTVLTQGVLTAVSEGNPVGEVVSAGSDDVFVARYRFYALHEDWVVKKLTVINDLDEEFDSPADTFAVSDVKIRYTDANAVQQERSMTMVDGRAIFSNLGMGVEEKAFFVPKGGDAYMEVYADVNAMAAVGEALSGQEFRLGIQDTDNNVTTFEAVGQFSSTADYFSDGNEISGSGSVNTFVVRKSKPAFAKASGLSTTLSNAENTLYGVKVAANNAGSITLARLVFEVNHNVTLSDFSFAKGASLVSGVNIHDTGTGYVIVSFDHGETIAAGAFQTYYLKAVVNGAIPGSYVKTRLAAGDEANPVTGKTSNTTPNTARIYSSTITDSLFAAAGDFVGAVDTARNVIWSDKSADMHMYPTVANGVVTLESGSADWTNGYLLNIGELASHKLSY